MKRSEKLAYLKDNHLDIFLKTRQKVLKNYLTNRQCFAVVVGLLQAYMRIIALSLTTK